MNFATIKNKLINIFSGDKAEDIDNNFSSEYEASLIETIRQTEQDLMVAQLNFNEALSAEEIEYSIYNLKAIESKYIMLLTDAKKKKIKYKGSLSSLCIMPGTYYDRAVRLLNREVLSNGE